MMKCNMYYKYVVHMCISIAVIRVTLIRFLSATRNELDVDEMRTTYAHDQALPMYLQFFKTCCIFKHLSIQPRQTASV